MVFKGRALSRKTERRKTRTKEEKEGRRTQRRKSNNPKLEEWRKLENESPMHVLNDDATYSHTDMRSNVYEDGAIFFCESLIRMTQSFQLHPSTPRSSIPAGTSTLQRHAEGFGCFKAARHAFVISCHKHLLTYLISGSIHQLPLQGQVCAVSRASLSTACLL